MNEDQEKGTKAESGKHQKVNMPGDTVAIRDEDRIDKINACRDCNATQVEEKKGLKQHPQWIQELSGGSCPMRNFTGRAKPVWF